MNPFAKKPKKATTSPEAPSASHACAACGHVDAPKSEPVPEAPKAPPVQVTLAAAWTPPGPER